MPVGFLILFAVTSNARGDAAGAVGGAAIKVCAFGKGDPCEPLVLKRQVGGEVDDQNVSSGSFWKLPEGFVIYLLDKDAHVLAGSFNSRSIERPGPAMPLVRTGSHCSLIRAAMRWRKPLNRFDVTTSTG